MFETKRLIINQLEMDDVEVFAKYRNKAIVAKYQSWNNYSVEEAKKRIQTCKKNKFSLFSRNYQLAIRLPDGKLIGDLYLEPKITKKIAIGYTLDDQYWNQGYGVEVVQGLLEWLTNQQFQVVFAHVYPENIRSRKLLEKLGFTQINTSKLYGDITYKKVLEQEF